MLADGCFWHGRPTCYTRPKTNRAFWDKKREDNMARDRRVNRELRARGWQVIRIWEHALKKSPHACIARIRRALEGKPKNWKTEMLKAEPSLRDGPEAKRKPEKRKAESNVIRLHEPRVCVGSGGGVGLQA